MKEMTLERITQVCNGRYVGDPGLLGTEVTGITIDSRGVVAGCLFVGLTGARVDGHDYIPGCMRDGALCALSEVDLGDVDYPYILVDSTHQGLKDMAKFYREVLDVKVVGVTGSVGKTSTKEMIASVLGTRYKVLKTAGNFNNEIGLPLTIFNLREDHEVAVLEMGINQFGEMSRLTDVAGPDVAVITNIGCCHLEFLGDLDGVLRAKAEIFESMTGDDCVILNGMDEQLRKVGDVHGQAPLFFGMGAGCGESEVDGGSSAGCGEGDSTAGCGDGEVGGGSSAGCGNRFRVYASDVEDLGLKGSRCKIHLGDSVIRPTISIPGEHMVLNAMAGAMVGVELGLSPEEICAGIEALVPVSGRNNILWGARYTVIDDCYNANPVSMKASLDVLARANTRKVAILGDMGELGVDAVAMHQEVGAYAARSGADVVICIGALARHMAKAAEDVMLDPLEEGVVPSKVMYHQDMDGFLLGYEEVLEAGDTILVKSSNFMKFSEIVDVLRD